MLFTACLVGVGALVGCSPLPGDALDPVYLKRGPQTAPASAETASPAPKDSPPAESRAAGTTEWVGRYRDSRGDGEVTFSIVRVESSIAGTWRLRTGGGGQVNGVSEGGGRRMRLRMENTASECPGTLEGWAEISETTLVGAYHGKDCEGPVSDGWLELRSK